MKYIVEVKYTNPAHEHVSLRRRVETVKRVVEAATEAEAINRAVRQQRALGFLIRESAVVNTGAVEQSLSAGSAVNKPKKKVVGDEGETEIKKEPVKEADSKRYMRPVENQLPAGLDKPKKTPEETKKEPVKEEAIDEARPMSDPVFRSVATKALTKDMDPNFGNPPNKLPAHIKAAQAKSDALSKVAKRPQAGTLAAQKANEEFEQVDEAERINLIKRAAVKRKMGAGTFMAKVNARATALSKQAQDNSDSAYRQSVLAKTPRNEAVEDKKSKADEDAEKVDEARKMSRVEWRMGTQDTVDANNYKIFKKLSATDPVKAKAFHDNLLKMKKKDVKEEVEDKKAGKSRKAAERMINLAKGKKNQINLEPFVDTHKVPMLPTTGK
jgi:hypothetical protein